MVIEIFLENNFPASVEAGQAILSFFPALLQTAETTPTLVFLFIIFIIGILSPLLGVYLTARMIIGWYRNKWVLIHGEPAEAKILKIWETGASVNDQPQVGMLLEVHAKDRPVFHGEAKRVVSILNIPRLQVGATVEVKFDPQNPSRIAVVL